MPEKIVFHIGNALKYAIRSKFKGYEMQDLEKCEFYVKDARDLFQWKGL